MPIIRDVIIVRYPGISARLQWYSKKIGITRDEAFLYNFLLSEFIKQGVKVCALAQLRRMLPQETSATSWIKNLTLAKNSQYGISTIQHQRIFSPRTSYNPNHVKPRIKDGETLDMRVLFRLFNEINLSAVKSATKNARAEWQRWRRLRAKPCERSSRSKLQTWRNLDQSRSSF